MVSRGRMMDSLVERIQTSFQLLKRSWDSEVFNKIDMPITKPQLFLLYVIQRNERCRLSKLAEKIEVKPSAITVMINRLEKAGYVKRTHDTVDRRSVLVELTLSGRKVLEETMQKRNEILKKQLSQLKPEEVQLLAELLEKLVSIKPE
jgi:DNA-binding MarR family transcriptional regulator